MNKAVLAGVLAFGLLGPVVLGWVFTLLIVGVVGGGALVLESKKGKELTRYVGR